MDIKRKPFQGVLNILNFNRHFYIYGFITLFLIILIVNYLKLPEFLYWIIIIGFSYGLITPLIVSAYVYDFSGFYNFNWLNKITFNGTQNLVNINAGFDETSYTLKKHFPESDLQVFDFYNADKHTEPAIIRARKVSQHYPNTKSIISNRIPLKDQTIDVVFLISSAHEIRNFEEKVMFLKECKRVLKPTGRIILVEHLRDFPNFLAFTIGFTHFFSQRTWLKVFKIADLSLEKETKFTPFMSTFQFK
jgi:SAM-dependent methyltransferase